MAAKRESLRFSDPDFFVAVDSKRGNAIVERTRAYRTWVFDKDPRLLVLLGLMNRRTRAGWRKLGVVNPHPDVLKR